MALRITFIDNYDTSGYDLTFKLVGRLGTINVGPFKDVDDYLKNGGSATHVILTDTEGEIKRVYPVSRILYLENDGN